MSKLQSAMEYIMTNRWVILAISVVLGVLFFLGGFVRAPRYGPCIALSGYVCSSPQFGAATGNMVVTIGQATETTWYSVNVVFVPSGTSTANPPALFNSPGATGNVVMVCPSCSGTGIGVNPLEQYAQSLQSQRQLTVNVPINSVITDQPKFNIGQTVSGGLWAQWTTSLGGPFYYVQIATVTLRAQ